MEKTATPVYVTVTVPWLPQIVEVVDGKTVVNTQYLAMPVVAWLENLDYGVLHGAN
jgi:hypothetical protein